MDMYEVEKVLLIIRNNSGISIPELQYLTGFSQKVVLDSVKFLFDRKLINWRVSKNNQIGYYCVLSSFQNNLRDW